MLGHVSRNPRRGAQLPSVKKAEDAMMFLTQAEFSLMMESLGERYRDFTNMQDMTGARLGYATVVTMANIDLVGTPASACIDKAWKRDGRNQFYIGPEF